MSGDEGPLVRRRFRPGGIYTRDGSTLPCDGCGERVWLRLYDFGRARSDGLVCSECALAGRNDEGKNHMTLG